MTLMTMKCRSSLKEGCVRSTLRKWEVVLWTKTLGARVRQSAMRIGRALCLHLKHLKACYMWRRVSTQALHVADHSVLNGAKVGL